MDDIDPKSGFHWQSRRIGYTNPAKHSEYISLLLTRLSELQAKTDPRLGDSSAKGKDMAAFEALKYARDLVDAVAGWAIDHQVGLAVEGREFLPMYSPRVRDLPEYRDQKAEVDHHRHEARGTELRLGEIPQEAMRQAAINLLHSNAGAMPGSLNRSLVLALRALDVNDVHPILKKGGAGRKVSLREMDLQLQALCFVTFRTKSKMMTAGEAHAAVAEAYSVSVDTLRSWSKRLRDEFGQLKVAANTQWAENAASYVAELRRERGRAIAMMEDNEHYGTKALKRVASEYRQRGFGAQS